jgi:hypothetical protein
MMVAGGGPNGQSGPHGQEPELGRGDDDVRPETNITLFYDAL